MVVIRCSNNAMWAGPIPSAKTFSNVFHLKVVPFIRRNFIMRTRKLLGLAKPYLEKNDFGVDHTIRVLDIARMHFKIPKELEEFVSASIVLHDIGGSTREEQYERGPEIATTLLRQLGYSEEFIKGICEVIGTHHERLDYPSEAFKILYDADQLAKFSSEEFPHYEARKVDWDSIINLMYHEHSKILARKLLKEKKNSLNESTRC